LAMLQNAVVEISMGKFSLFILGFLFLTGLIMGRFACGWLCPFGLLQELIFKVPLPKVRLKESFKRFEYLKYGILILFIFILPAFAVYGVSETAFCKYICPVEVIEANFPLILARPSLIRVMGILFKWKLFLLLIILLMSAVIFKPFCRFICPLGAIYALFNPVSLYHFQVERAKCISCAQCLKKCKLGITVFNDPNNRECMRCNECLECPTQALRIKRFWNPTQVLIGKNFWKKSS
jgi:hypothetical protein